MNEPERPPSSISTEMVAAGQAALMMTLVGLVARLQRKGLLDDADITAIRQQAEQGLVFAAEETSTPMQVLGARASASLARIFGMIEGFGG